jgi:hypothetical protein
MSRKHAAERGGRSTTVKKRLVRIAGLTADLSRELARRGNGGAGAAALADAIAYDVKAVRRALERAR